MKKRALAWTQNRSGIYIIPNRWGLGFLTITFIFFYLGISINNNTLLMMAFWPFSMFFVMLIVGHFNIANFKLEKVKVPDHFNGSISQAEILAQCRYGGLELHYEMGKDFYGPEMSEKPKATKGTRTHYQGQRVHVWSDFPFGLFYVWRYYPIVVDYYTYPKFLAELETKEEFSNLFEVEGIDEFSGLRNFITGEGAQRLHWKSVASGQDWKIKSFQNEEHDGLHFDWNEVEAETERKLEILGTLVTIAHRKNLKWSMTLPHHKVFMATGEGHWQKCMRLLSEYS